MEQYFATKPADELVKELEQKIKGFHTFLEGTGLSKRASRAERVYFGRHQGETGVGSFSIGDAGVDGEMSTVTVNKFRTLIKHALSYTVTQKPAWDPKAKNSDTKSGQQARLSVNVLDHYLNEKRLGRHMNQAAERSLVTGKGYVYMTWDPSLGEPYAVAPVNVNGEQVEKVVYEGDVECSAKGWADVIYDYQLRDWNKKRWVIVKEYENKWDLAARHPDKAEEIQKCAPTDDFEFNQRFQNRRFDDKSSQDIIPVYYFYHVKTDGVKGGRFTKFLGNKTALYDGPMQYRRLPLFRIAPGDEFDTCEGYTDAFDLMALQEAMNILTSTGFSNLQAYAGQKLWLPDGCNISPSSIDDGMVVLKGGIPGAEPKILNLTNIPPELLKFLELCGQFMVEGMGQNQATVGDKEHGLDSGVAIARMQAMAVQFASNFQRSWVEIQEDVGTFLVELLQDFAKTERMIAISGTANKGAMQSFTGKDLASIQRVSVSLGNPTMRTTAGILNFASMLYEKGEINGREFIHINSTGSFDQIAERKEADVELVQMENEMLRDGRPVKAVVGDGHLYHMDQQRAVINDPQLREWASQGDPMAVKIIESATLHLQWHNFFYNTQDPIFSVIAKEPPAPMRMMADPMDMSNPNMDQSLPPPAMIPPPMPAPAMPQPGAPMPEQGGPPPQGAPPQGQPMAPPPEPPGPQAPEPPPLPPMAA